MIFRKKMVKIGFQRKDLPCFLFGGLCCYLEKNPVIL